MAAAILHSHRNSDVNPAVVLPEAILLITKGVRFFLSLLKGEVRCVLFLESL